MDRWGSLYLAACAALGDENRAGDLLLQARDEDHLESMLRQYGELPPALPAPAPDTLDHVAYLRRRARLRRLLTKIWTGGAMVAAAAAVVGLLLWRGGEPPAEPVYAVPAIASLTRDNLELQVHRAEAAPGAVTIWWSLSGRGVGLASEAPSMIVGLFDRWQSPEEENVTFRRVNRDLVYGKTVVEEVVDRPTHAQLVLVSQNTRFALGFEVDRSSLAQLERHIPVQQVMSRAGVGLLVREVVQGPGYTRLVYEPWQEKDSPFRLLSVPLIDQVVTDQGAVPVRDPNTLPLRLGPVDHQATELRLETHRALRVEANLRLPLRQGAKEPLTGLKVTGVKETLPGVSEFTLVSEGPAVAVETFRVASHEGGYVQRSRWGAGSPVPLKGGPAATFTVTHPLGARGELQLHLETLWLAPPAGIKIHL
ncbi:MAG: hypothetical protein ACOY94_20930 [Bacillota bacterium]